MKAVTTNGNVAHLAQLLDEADLPEAEKQSMMAAFVRSQRKHEPPKDHAAIAKRRAKNKAARRARARK